MRTVALLAIAALALAGCSSKSGPDNHTCAKTGRVIDLSLVEGSGKKGFDPESACPAPIPPSVAFAKVPTAMTAYFPALGTWTVATGNYTQGHSMLTQLRMSAKPIVADQLKKPDDYGSVLAQFAHQDVPGKFDAKLKFEKAGTYYLRAYAQVRGEGLPDTDFWSPEVQVVVAPVNATGKSTEVVRAAGPALAGQTGKLAPNAVSAVLGDAIVLVNDDVVPHTFTFSGTCKHDPIAVEAQGGHSGQIMLLVPGTCKATTDDQAGPQTVAINVAEPA
jgi:hypothetical protein